MWLKPKILYKKAKNLYGIHKKTLCVWICARKREVIMRSAKIAQDICLETFKH